MAKPIKEFDIDEQTVQDFSRKIMGKMSLTNSGE